MDENIMNASLVLTPPATANPPVTSVESSSYGCFRNRPCDCIRSLADILERISGDVGSGSDQIDQADSHFDGMLGCLHGGIDTCKQVLLCKHCSVCTTNPMFIVTITQQLAAISQDLCRQLLAYQQKVKTTTATTTMSAVGDDTPPLLPSAGIYVGKYQVRSAALCEDFLFGIVNVHVKDLHRLLDHLRNDVKKGTRAFKILSDATDVAKTASHGLGNNV